MTAPILRVAYDNPKTAAVMIDWMVDSDPVELGQLAQNLLSDVETLKAQLAAAKAEGYAEAGEVIEVGTAEVPDES